MTKKSSSESGAFRRARFPRLCRFSPPPLALAEFGITQVQQPAVTPGRDSGTNSEPERYMPVPGGDADDLNLLETQWMDRLSYPTGRFDPAWVRNAAEQDSQISRAVSPCWNSKGFADEFAAIVESECVHGPGPGAWANDRLLRLLRLRDHRRPRECDRR